MNFSLNMGLNLGPGVMIKKTPYQETKVVFLHFLEWFNKGLLYKTICLNETTAPRI